MLKKLPRLNNSRYDADADEDYYYAHDHLYSPTALLDDSGAVVERMEYNAYGQADVTLISGSGTGNEYLFTGRRLDILDGGSFKIYYYRNRYYDPHTGRFMTHDPLGITPNAVLVNSWNIVSQYANSMNVYEYVSGRPMIASDPLGLVDFIIGSFQSKTVSGDGEMEFIIEGKGLNSDRRYYGKYNWQVFYMCNLDSHTVQSHGSAILFNVSFGSYYHEGTPGHPEIGFGFWTAEREEVMEVENEHWERPRGCNTPLKGEKQKMTFDVVWKSIITTKLAFGAGWLTTPGITIQHETEERGRDSIEAEFNCCCVCGLPKRMPLSCSYDPFAE